MLHATISLLKTMNNDRSFRMDLATRLCIDLNAWMCGKMWISAVLIFSKLMVAALAGAYVNEP